MTPGTINHPGERRWETNLLTLLTIMLTAFGIINCYAAGTYKAAWWGEASQQASAAVIGGILFLIASHLDYTLWKKVAKPAFYLTLAGLVVLAAAAKIWPKPDAPEFISDLFPQLNGARRWIKFGVQVQVSEIARFTLALYMSVLVAEMGPKLRLFKEGYAYAMGIVGAVTLLVFMEPSLSMAIVLAGVGAAIIFAAGGKIQHFAPTVLLGIVAVWYDVTHKSFRQERYTEFLTPALQCDARNDQSCISLIGIGDGGIFGSGFGQGTQKMGHLPYAYSDFLFSVIGEEWGLLGITFILILFALFCWVGFRIARTAREPFGTYFATGITMTVALTALLHAAVALRMMPPTGLTLPFMSAGRASLILYLMSAGILVNIGQARGRPSRRK